MNRWKAPFFLLLTFGIAAVTFLFFQMRVQPPFSRSFGTLFQELGKPVKTVDRAVSRIYPVNAIDEKMLGDEIKAELAHTSLKSEPATVKYLNALVNSFRKETSFDYAVFLVEGPPNAYAMPGGAICVTTGLMNILESEAELVSILGHEMGHIERGHLFDAARDEMLRKKIRQTTPIDFASAAIRTMMRFSFSKSQEDEADEYGFRLLVANGYDPMAMSRAFEKLVHDHGHHAPGLLDDFFTTHPQPQLRREKFRARAQLWLENYPDAERYNGIENFAQRTSRFEKRYEE